MAETPSIVAPQAASAEVLVIVAHPSMEQSRVNRGLLRAAQQAGPRVAVRELYRLYPDYLIDVAAEQAQLAQARLVVWQHPIHWYHMPPLMKLWVDEVLAFGWAYGPGGTALRGKDLWLVGSTGGSQESYSPASYNRYFFDAFLPAYEQTATLCGMRFLPPMLVQGAHRITREELAQQAEVYAQRLTSWPDWPELESLAECVACEVPDEARPHESLQTGAA
ncbi:MAG TPA: NAD(P)H-dependent oxidoreductase [Albitalea sp.]|nr:NAD(P)H-dependent oxidoreductase [Albitalea sp.]